MKINKFVLVNYEGNALFALKLNENTILVYDQWNKLVDRLSVEGFHDFINGKTLVTDSSGKEWNFLDVHTNAKPNSLEIEIFVNEHKVVTAAKIIKLYISSKLDNVSPEVCNKIASDISCVIRDLTKDHEVITNEILYKYLK